MSGKKILTAAAGLACLAASWAINGSTRLYRLALRSDDWFAAVTVAFFGLVVAGAYLLVLAAHGHSKDKEQ